MSFRLWAIVGLCLLVIAPHHSAHAQNDHDHPFLNAYQIASPSIVAIQAEIFVNGLWQVVITGSGVIVDEAGHIITHTDIIQSADRLTVYFFDATQTRATLIASDPISNMALIRVDLPPEFLIPSTFANSQVLTVGQTLLAIVTPFGEQWTLTSGMISTPPRYAIQTDMTLPTGGILINLLGEIIGIAPPLGDVGIRFAIPSHFMRRVAQSLIADGVVEYSYLGVNGADISLAFMEQFNLPNALQGAIMLGIADDAPAFRAGILRGDVIVAIDNMPIVGWDDLTGYLAQNTIARQTVMMRVYRGGGYVDMVVTLGSHLTG